jgi:hypothetical protein
VSATGQKYPLVRINFLDHCQFSGDLAWEPIQCELTGRLVQETPVHYIIATWIADQELNSPDTELFCVIKHPGLEITKVKG